MAQVHGISAFGFIFLAACGGSGGSTGTTGSGTSGGPPAAVFQDVAERLASATVSAPAEFTVSGPTLQVADLSGATSGALLADRNYTVSAVPDGNGSYTISLTYQNETRQFAADDFLMLDDGSDNEFTLRDVQGNRAFLVSSFLETWPDVAEGTATFDYLVAGAAAIFEGDGFEATYGVFGAETLNMPSTGTGVGYTGVLIGDVITLDDSFDLEAEIIILVDFVNQGSLTGEVTNISIDDFDNANTFIFNPVTSFTGNTFSTTANVGAGCGMDCATLQSSSIDGGFYGPNAEEIGGTFSVAGTLPIPDGMGGSFDEDFVAAGIFGLLED